MSKRMETFSETGPIVMAFPLETRLRVAKDPRKRLINQMIADFSQFSIHVDSQSNSINISIDDPTSP